MKILKKTLLAAAAVTALSLSAHAQGTVEVMHWWTSGGEAKSVAELKKMVEAKGVVWKDNAIAGGGGDAAMTALKARVIAGNAPAAAQIKGPAIQDWGNEGALASINDAAKGWDAVLPKVVSDVMKFKGDYVAAPVNVHRVNWLWVSGAALEKVGAKAPTTFDEFFAVADKMKAAGITAVAHGGQPWQDATLFESVVIGVGGADFYKKAIVGLDQAAIKSDTMTKVFDTMRKIKGYTDAASAGRDWNLTTAMVINGTAGMQFMGDWAKGEFTAAGKMPGKDYFCVAAPGTANAFTFNIDSMAMFKQKDPAAQKAQLVLAETIMSSDFQEVFNLNKGSIPARAGVSKAKFDACALKSMDDMDATAKGGGLVPSFAHKMAIPAAAEGAITDAVTKFMNSTQSSADGVAALAKAAATK
jgi:glucose/mannose transport system substrate-binding protein